MGHAAALAVLTVLILEPEVTCTAILRRAFPSASASVPVLVGVRSWVGVIGQAEAFAALVVPVLVSTASTSSSWFSADALAVGIIPPVVAWARLPFAHAVAVVFGPEETFRALLWSASADALDIVKDFVVTANLRSADAATNRNIVVVEGVRAHVDQDLALAVISIPVVVWTNSRAVRVGVNEEALAVIAGPEFARCAILFVANAVGNDEIPEVSVSTVFGVLLAATVSDLIDVPEVATGALLRLLFATAVNSVEEFVWWAHVRWAAAALAGSEVPNLVTIALLG